MFISCRLIPHALVVATKQSEGEEERRERNGSGTAQQERREESSGMVESASTHDEKSRARGAANAATEAQQALFCGNAGHTVW